MPIQNTFTLVPTAAALAPRTPTGGRPMTSKQVSKAYKAANRMPKMSRADRIKQERAEQERIRKELEREKSAAKAKAARDKKKEQERAEREERKRNGRPLVDVRASQNTMTSFFTRGPIKPKETVALQVQNETENNKREQAGEQEPIEQEETEQGQIEQEETERVQIEQEQTGQEHTEQEQNEQNQLEQNHTERENDVSVDRQLPENGPIREMKSEAVVPLEPKEPQAIDPEKLLLEDMEGLVDVEDVDDIDFDLLDTDALNLDLDLLCASKGPSRSENAHNSPVPPKAPKPVLDKPTPERHRPETPYERDLGLTLAKKRKWEDSEPRRNSSCEVRVTPMGPPPRPPPPPPLSTQYIGDIDDFFPTASQQIRELDEEDIDITRQWMPPPPVFHKPSIRAQEPVPAPRPQPIEPATPAVIPKSSPKRFFTASGSQELMSLALHRSIRTAKLEELQQKDRMRVEAGMLQQQETLGRREQSRQQKKQNGSQDNKPQNKTSTSITPKQQKPSYEPAMNEKKAEKQAPFEKTPEKKEASIDKENAPPQATRDDLPMSLLTSSQETDYGGQWLDEIPLDIQLLL